MRREENFPLAFGNFFQNLPCFSSRYKKKNRLEISWKKRERKKIIEIAPGSNEIRGIYFDTTINPVGDYMNEKVGRQTRPFNARHGFKIQYYCPVFQSGRNHKFFTSFRRNPVHLNISNRKPIYSIRLPEITFARCQFALGLTWRMAPPRSFKK